MAACIMWLVRGKPCGLSWLPDQDALLATRPNLELIPEGHSVPTSQFLVDVVV